MGKFVRFAALPHLDKYTKFEDIMSKEDRQEIEGLIKKIRAMWSADDMTPNQRLYGAATGGDVDHVPLTWVPPTEKVALEIGGDFVALYTDPVFNMKAMLTAVLKYQSEMLVPFFALDQVMNDAYGTKVEYLPTTYPKVTEWAIKRGFEEILENDVPDPRDSDSLKWQILTTNYLNQHLGDMSGISLNCTCGPYYTYSCMLRGPINAMRDFKHHPDLAVQALDKIYEYCLAVFKYMLKETGGQSYFNVESFVSPSFTPPAWFEKFCAPYERRLVQDMAPLPGSIGGGGQGTNDFTPILETLIDMGYTGLSVCTPTDLGKLKELSATRGITVTYNALTGVDVRDSTPEQIHEKLKAILEIGKPGKKFFIGGDTCDEATPDENIHAVREAVRKYGKY